ncbi:hypothetical protein GIB67_028519 [Kingdonia uniflora]|uniref:Protein kinase domain-containing protein n=1 Tax=Kingdonia uniflora TaxID=39325 RepID=A0A7J7KVZ0_9MAGN|nr:hypothetical protein GIB67_028519 [Kingdonia uniflora]
MLKMISNNNCKSRSTSKSLMDVPNSCSRSLKPTIKKKTLIAKVGEEEEEIGGGDVLDQLLLAYFDLSSIIHQHKHLVGFVGFCEEKEKRLLVYEFMKNGTLYDHLHLKENIDKASSILNSWKVRIKIALDDVRGIEYLHSYAVPSIIHRDIKFSNMWLDENWTARVLDFGLSLMGPES